jgi:hypothetical protein
MEAAFWQSDNEDVLFYPGTEWRGMAMIIKDIELGAGRGEGWREFQVSTTRMSNFPSVLRCLCLSVSPRWTGRYKRNKSIIKKDQRVEKPQPRFTRQSELAGGYVAVFGGGSRGGRGDPEWVG